MVNPAFPHFEYRWRGGARRSFVARALYGQPVKGCEVCDGHSWLVSLAEDAAGESEAFWSGSIETQDSGRPPSAVQIWEAMVSELLSQLKYCSKAAPEAIAMEGQPGDPAACVLEDIADERRRQISEEEHPHDEDDELREGELAIAAAAYALSSVSPSPRSLTINDSSLPAATPGELAASIWPFDYEEIRPRSSRHDLVRAAALLVAEIERLDRATVIEAEAGQ